MDLRPVTADELEAFVAATQGAFHKDVHAEDLEEERRLFEPARSLAVFDGREIVATSGIYTRELTVPGGVVTAAAVTAVGVRPTHRRRGLLSRLMRRQLDDVRAAGEPVAALWASEPAIYGRFGYGLASFHADVRLHTPGARLHPRAPAPDGRTLLLDPGAAVARIAPLYDAVRRARPGHLDRPERWWRHRVYDPEHERAGYGALRAAVHEAPGGAVDGYALYRVKHGEWIEGPDATVAVGELVADGPAATAALWAFLLGLDLTRTIEWWWAAADEPLFELLAGPHRPQTALAPNLWIRLVDVGAALAARTYAAPVGVVLEVADELCPWNAGRWRLEGDDTGAACARTDAPADLGISVADLGAVYLGGRSLDALAAAGRVDERSDGALRRATAAFRGPREPLCPEIF
ncbi:MAG TPA: GNAT family N-acetyltransferase [Solirubrobacteraceae bacterium]|nr:GNAT family N-acetyltransferase [Solirubrobacteraceae bacterium]